MQVTDLAARKGASKPGDQEVAARELLEAIGATDAAFVVGMAMAKHLQ